MKMIRDFGILVVLGFVFLFVSSSAFDFENIIVVAGSAGLFSILSEIVRCVNEIDLEERRQNLSEDKIKRIVNIRLVIRDSLIAFMLVYGIITYSFGVVTFAEGIGYMIAALAPTMIVTAISKELRIPGTNMLVVGKQKVDKIA